MGWGVSVVVCSVNLSTAIVSMNHDTSLRNFLTFCLWSSLAPSMEQPHQRLSGERYNTCIYTVFFMHLLSVRDILYNDWSIVWCIITLSVHTVVYVYWLQICWWKGQIWLLFVRMRCIFQNPAKWLLAGTWYIHVYTVYTLVKPCCDLPLPPLGTGGVWRPRPLQTSRPSSTHCLWPLHERQALLVSLSSKKWSGILKYDL